MLCTIYFLLIIARPIFNNFFITWKIEGNVGRIIRSRSVIPLPLHFLLIHPYPPTLFIFIYQFNVRVYFLHRCRCSVPLKPGNNKGYAFL